MKVTRRIAPLFYGKGLACHGKDEAKIKGGLALRTLAATRTHDDDGKAIPPKKADKLYAEQVTWIK